MLAERIEIEQICFFITKQILTNNHQCLWILQDSHNHPQPPPPDIMVHLLVQIQTALHLTELTLS